MRRAVHWTRPTLRQELGVEMAMQHTAESVLEQAQPPVGDDEHLGQPEPDQAARAFDTGMRGYIGGNHTHRLPPREECSLAEFDAALQTLNQSVPAIKRRIVDACAACILANQQVTVREVELLRAICDTLDCPLPPLVVGEAEGR